MGNSGEHRRTLFGGSFGTPFWVSFRISFGEPSRESFGGLPGYRLGDHLGYNFNIIPGIIWCLICMGSRSVHCSGQHSGHHSKVLRTRRAQIARWPDGPINCFRSRGVWVGGVWGGMERTWSQQGSPSPQNDIVTIGTPWLHYGDTMGTRGALRGH
jgi:hypothetical protein